MLSEFTDLTYWEDLQLPQLAMLGILVHRGTTTYRISQVFNAYLQLNSPNDTLRHLAREMLDSGKSIPELAALNPEDRAVVEDVVIKEYQAMQRALERGIDYTRAFEELYPGIFPFPSPIIWIRKSSDVGIALAKSYTYEDLMIHFIRNDPEIADYRGIFRREIALYSHYLKLMNGKSR